MFTRDELSSFPSLVFLFSVLINRTILFRFREYIDLSRNQKLLRELVSRRGLPVLDSIPSGLQRTKSILAGNLGRDPPSNIASRLM